MFIHEKHIGHLDLKPSNILVSKATDLCKISDFGSCIDLTESSQTVSLKINLTGTYPYCAPELFRGNAIKLYRSQNNRTNEG